MLNAEELFDQLTGLLYPDCSDVTRLQNLGLHPDSINFGFFVGRGANFDQARVLVDAFNGNFRSFRQLQQQLKTLA